MAPIDWGDLVTVQSSEVLELRMPLLVETSRLATDSGGAGRNRGGLSMQRTLRVLAPDTRYSLLSDGAIVPAFGVLGGLAGFPVGSWVDHDGEVENFDTPGKVAGHPVEQGAAVVIRSAGGGGYGDPTERDPARVAEDVREGYVSNAAAHQLYGVVLDKAGEPDAEATAALRKRLKESRFKLVAVEDDSSFEAGSVSRRRIARINPADAIEARLNDDDVIEMDARKAAPLRAWLRIDPKVVRGTLPIDAHGLTILKSQLGDELELRAVLTSVHPRVVLATAAE
jgi:N-methylhydantoinase B